LPRIDQVNVLERIVETLRTLGQGMGEVWAGAGVKLESHRQGTDPESPGRGGPLIAQLPRQLRRPAPDPQLPGKPGDSKT
jgi:hypothetical protein